MVVASGDSPVISVNTLATPRDLSNHRGTDRGRPYGPASRLVACWQVGPHLSEMSLIVGAQGATSRGPSPGNWWRPSWGFLTFKRLDHGSCVT